jgi:uncharacterized membrane protein
MRQPLIKHGVGEETGFRWRGREVSRLEGFTDAVFGFIITLLVISTEVPRNFNDLLNLFSFSNVGSFVICFLALVLLWRSHYIFFRRYGLEDGAIFLLNTVFLLTVTLYIYPLKFLFAWMLLGFPVAAPGTGAIDAAAIRIDQIYQLLMIYGVGIVLLYLSQLGLYAWAYHKRAQLGLSALEIYDTVTTIGSNAIVILVGLVSILITLLGQPDSAAWAGFVYMLLAPGVPAYRLFRNRLRRRYLTA